MNRRLLRVFVGGLARRRAASLLSLLAIALGVALGLAVQLVHRAALEEFAHGLRTLAGDADLQVSGPRGGFDDALFETLLLHPMVADASPVVDLEVKVYGRDETLRLLGVDVLRLPALQPALIPQPADRSDRYALLAGDALFPSPALAERLRLAPGDRLSLQAGLAPEELRVAGALPGAGGQPLAVMDIHAAQTRFGMAGRLSRIDLRLRAGVDRRRAERTLAALLPAGVTLATPQDAEQQAGALSRAYRVNLTMLAAIALVTGGFLVFSTQALSIARRHGEFAFLRTLGLPAAELMHWVLAEGALAGLLGGLLGAALGHAVAAVAFQLLGADLGAGYFKGLRPALHIDWPLSTGFVALGVAAGVAGAWIPGRVAARVLPAAALKAAGEAPLVAARGHPVAALACVAGALLLALAPPLDGIPVAGYLAIALLLAGGVLGLGRVAGWMAQGLPQRRSAPLLLARARLVAAPGNAVVAGAGVLASAALAVAMMVMVASFRDSVDHWLQQVLPAQAYVRASQAGNSAFLDPSVQAELESLPGVARIDFLRHERIRLSADRPPVALIARPVSPDGRELVLVAGGGGGGDPVWISEALADQWELGPGSTLAVPLAGRLHRFQVAGVWRDYVRRGGALVLPLARYRALSGDLRASDAAVDLQAGTTLADFVAAVHARFGSDALEIATPGEIRATSLRIFDRTFAITYLLEAAAVLIGLAGVVASFAAMAAARRREFGMLRHLGLTRGQIAAMLATEGALVAAAGTGGGLMVGGAIAVVLVEVVNRQSFHWSMDYKVPVATLAAFALALVALAALAAVLAGRQAMGGEVLRAVSEDW